MKYIVVECHAGYAVLMDENALFVRAANLGYEVGQTVESPVLEESPRKQGKNIIIYRVVAAAAACMVLVTGFFVYQRNYAVYSKITISASADEICLQVNRKGEVLTAESINNSGSQLLEDYDPHGKDKITAAEEIVQKAVSMGSISDGDTVSLYIDTPENDYTEYKAEFEEHFRSDRKIKVDVKKYNHFEKNEKPERKEKITPTEEIITEKAEQTEIYQEIIPSENVNQENSDIVVEIPEQPTYTESNESLSDSDKNIIENNENFSDSNKNNFENHEFFSNSDKKEYDNSFSAPERSNIENHEPFHDYSPDGYENNAEQPPLERNDDYIRRNDDRNFNENHGSRH